MNELKLIRHIIPMLKQNNATVIGPGDDCAVVRCGDELLLLAADQVISDVHYVKTTPPEKIAAKLLKRNLSDIAAMGGTPFCALITLAGNIAEEEWFHRFFAGMATAAESFNVTISGGDIATLPTDCPPQTMVTTLTITGKVEEAKICRRNTASPGQAVLATGTFGNSFHSGHHLDFTPRLAEAALLAGDYTNCMIDVSDGLLLDLTRLAEASSVGIIMNTDSIPLRTGASLAAALSDGEDYELLFTVPPEQVAELLQNWPLATPLSVIGNVVSIHPGLVFDQNGVNLSANRIRGYEHYSE